MLGKWDCDALRRVTENLIGNAIKYGSRDTSITIELRASTLFVELKVHNEVSPIPEQEVPLFADAVEQSPLK